MVSTHETVLLDLGNGDLFKFISELLITITQLLILQYDPVQFNMFLCCDFLRKWNNRLSRVLDHDGKKDERHRQ